MPLIAPSGSLESPSPFEQIYSVPAGSTLSFPTQYAIPAKEYTNNSVIVNVTPAAPTQSGNTVTVPVPTAAYVYQNHLGQIVQPGQYEVPANGSLTFIAVSTSPLVNLTTAGPWLYSYVAPPAPPKTIGLSNDPASVTVPSGHVVTGAEFVINQINDPGNAPASISVVAGGQVYNVPLASFAGGTARYVMGLPNDARVTSASAVIYFEWSGQFTLGSYQSVSTGPVLILPPAAPTFVDKCGTANDTIVYSDLTEGIEKHVTGEFGGTTTVTTVLKRGFTVRAGTQLSWDHTFTNVPCEPVVTDPDPEPQPDPEPAPNPAPAPDPAPQTPATPQGQQVVSGRDHEVQTAAVGGATSPSAPSASTGNSVNGVLPTALTVAGTGRRRARRVLV
jgi:hypothetical protein